jgi:hypothetical protein
MNWNILIVLIAPAIILLIDWIRGGANFEPKKNIPWYLLAVFIPGTLFFFIDKPVVQHLLLIGAGIAIVHIFKGLIKVGSGTPVQPAQPGVYGAKLNNIDKKPFFLNPYFGWMVLFAFAAFLLLLVHSQSYYAEVHNQITLSYIVGGICLALAVFFLVKTGTTSDGKGG